MIRTALVVMALTLLVLSGCSIPGEGGGALAVSGNGVPIANGHWNANELDGTDFGQVDPVDPQREALFEVTNTGDRLLTFSQDSALRFAEGNPEHFRITAGLPASLAPGRTATLAIAFRPESAGLLSTIVAITPTVDGAELTDEPEPAFVFRIQGLGGSTGDGAVVGSDGSLIPNGSASPSESAGTLFGSAMAGLESVEHVFALRNASALSGLRLTEEPAISLAGPHAADFAVLTQPDDLIPAGSDADFTIAFRPAADALGLRQAVVVIHSSDVTEPVLAFLIQGTAVPQTPSASG